MKALIIGATGLLGHAIFRHLSGRAGWTVVGTAHELALPGFERLDILDSAAVEFTLDTVLPDVVMVPASNPYVDYCERFADETRRLNVDATLETARSASRRGLTFVFFSTDYVFDGRKEGNYHEEDEPRPLNEYGRQKLAVERGLATGGGRYLVVRTSAIFGWELRPKNFVLQALARLQNGAPWEVASDLEYNPTYAPNLAEGVAELLERNGQGLYHLSGVERVSRANFAREVAKAFGLDASLIRPVPSLNLCGTNVAPRPRRTSLASEKAERLLRHKLLGTDEALRAMKASGSEWEEHAGRLLTASERTP